MGTAISTAVITSGAALQGAGTLGLAKLLTKGLLMTTTQKLAVTALVTAAVGAGFFQARRAGQMRASLQKAEGQVQALAEEATQLRQELDRTADTLKAAQGQLELSQSRAAKLSQEVTRLKAQLAANPDANPAVTLAGRVTLMKSHLEQRPEQRIPELQFAEEEDWLEGAKLVTTESDDDMRKGVSLVRTAAKLKFARELSLALRKYTAANNGDLPTDLSHVKTFFNVALDDAVLQRWEIYVTGNTREPGFDPGKTVVREKLEMLPDSLYDERVRVGLNNSTMEGSQSGMLPRLRNYELE